MPAARVGLQALLRQGLPRDTLAPGPGGAGCDSRFAGSRQDAAYTGRRLCVCPARTPVPVCILAALPYNGVMIGRSLWSQV